MRTEVRRGVPWPAWVVEYRARKRDQIGVAGTDDGFGLLKLGNKPDSDHGHARCPLHGARKWHLITRPDRDPLERSETAARHVNGRAAARFQRLCKRDCLVDVPSPIHPVGAGHAHRNRMVSREGGAHRIKDFEWKAHAVLQAATILIVATVGEWREELVQQIAVRAVELDGIDTEPRGALGRRSEGFTHPREALSVEGDRRVLAFLVRDRRRRDRLAAVRGAFRARRVAKIAKPTGSKLVKSPAESG